MDDAFYEESVNSFLSDNNSDFCDFPIISEDELKRSPMLYMSLSFILRWAIDHWPAINNWERSNLTSLYGRKSASTGSESSIVYGGGAAGVAMSLGDILKTIRNESLRNASNLFTFDVSILKSIPELKRNFNIPKAFRY